MHKGPLVVSHTGIRGICNTQRNLSDEQLIEIGKRNGLVGIGLFEMAVCDKTAFATAKSMRYVADLIGVDNVSLGLDWSNRNTFYVTGLPLLIDELIKLKFSRAEIE